MFHIERISRTRLLYKACAGSLACSGRLCARILVLFISLTCVPVFAQSSAGEYGSVFRPGHNLTVALGIQQSRWSLDLSVLEKPLTTERFNFLTSLSYGFHFRLFHRTGLVIGTATHVIFDRTVHQGFAPKVGLILPSILSGIVQSLGQHARLLLVGELGAGWYPYSKWKVQDAKVEFEGGVYDQITLSSQLDLGLQNSNVISIIAGWRLAADDLIGQPVGINVQSDSFPVSRHEGWYIALGITRLVTETLTGRQE
ncbi:MAG: hypothetical protein RJB13_1260 [Pseudomonadota bacterium]